MGEVWAVVCGSQVAFVEIVDLVDCLVDEVVVGGLVEVGSQLFLLMPSYGFKGSIVDGRDFEIIVTA